MWTRALLAIGMSGWMCGFAATPAALADDGPRSSRARSADVDVDIDALDAWARFDSQGAIVFVRYEVDVDIEDGEGHDAFDLVLTIYENNRLLVDGQGEPVGTIIPLDQPTRQEVDDDEAKLEFRGRAVLHLPPYERFLAPLVVRAEVRCAHDGDVMDSKSEEVEVRGYRSRRHIGIHIGWGAYHDMYGTVRVERRRYYR